MDDREARIKASPCEWDPERNDKARSIDEAHAEATISVGANGQWHLCESCAALPEFKRFRKRTRLRQRERGGR